MVIDEAVLEAAKKSFLFESMSDSEIIVLLEKSSAYISFYKQGDKIIEGEQSNPSIGLFVSGKADVYKDHSLSMYVNTLLCGDITGAATVFSDEKTAVTHVIAKQKTVVCWISDKDFLSCLSENSTLLKNYIRYMTNRVRFLATRIEALGELNASEKLYSYIVSNAEGKTLYVAQGFSALASSLGMGRSSLYRAIEQLVSLGKISREGKTIILI